MARVARSRLACVHFPTNVFYARLRDFCILFIVRNVETHVRFNIIVADDGRSLIMVCYLYTTQFTFFCFLYVKFAC